MKIKTFYLTLLFLLGSSILVEATSSLSRGIKQVIDNEEVERRIGGKIHFEEESGPDYIGTKEINQLVKELLKNLIDIKAGLSSDNAKIMLKKNRDQIIMTYYEEKKPTRNR